MICFVFPYVTFGARAIFYFLEGASHADELVDEGLSAGFASDRVDRSRRRLQRRAGTYDGAQLGVESHHRFAASPKAGRGGAAYLRSIPNYSNPPLVWKLTGDLLVSAENF